MASIIYTALFFCLLLSLHKAYCDTHVEKLTHLHFYWHEISTGPSTTALEPQNETAITVVKPARNDSFFGSIGVFDDMLKEGPDPSSKLIGRAQGFATVASMSKEGALLTAQNFVFTDGPYNGSTLAIFGRGMLGTVVERVIVGGTGKFRMARGYTLSKQVTPPGPPIQDLLVLEFDVYVWHF